MRKRRETRKSEKIVTAAVMISLLLMKKEGTLVEVASVVALVVAWEQAEKEAEGEEGREERKKRKVVAGDGRAN